MQRKLRGLSRLGGGLAMLAITALTSPGPAYAADRIAMRIEVFGLAGLHVATNRTVIQESGTDPNGRQYAIAGDVATTGLAGLFADLHSHSEVQGRLTATAVLPEAYRNDTRRNGADRRSAVDFPNEENGLSGSSTPPNAAPSGPKPAAARGAVDPLTAYFLLERRLGTGGDCTLNVPVFDGRSRYTLHFSDAGRQVLAPEGGQRFSGDAVACAMRREDMAGAAADPAESERAGTIWYARLVPGDLLLPVRLQMTTAAGTIDGYLAELHAGGVDRSFME